MKGEKMKFYLRYLLVMLIFTIIISCDKNFTEVNTSKTNLASVAAISEVNKAIYNSAPTTQNINCGSSIVKQQMRIFTGPGACGNFNVDVRTFSDANWNNGYLNVIRYLADVINRTKKGTNINDIARIWKAYRFMKITDTYGSIPYSGAAKGFLKGITFPKYDSQKSIYMGNNGIIEELYNATSDLDSSKPLSNTDLLYGGNVDKWQRLGNSLLLRAAMRLTKVEPDTAKKYIQIVVNRKLMRNNEDNAVIRHNANFPNSIGKSLNGGQSQYQYIVKDFVDFLKSNNDPRLASIAARYPGAKGKMDQNDSNIDTNPNDQIGIPMGFNNNTIIPVAKAAGLSSFYAYSQANRHTIMSPTAPQFIVTYAMQEFLLAEAAVRHWIAKDPEELYENGIRADMRKYKAYGASSAIDPDDISNYISNHTLQTGKKLKQINTQYWVACYLVGAEAWANFRRSGFPKLSPNPLQANLESNVDFMHRLGYPINEVNSNPNYKSGATMPDNISTRVWWDAQLKK